LDTAKAAALDGLTGRQEGSRSHATAAGRELVARQPATPLVLSRGQTIKITEKTWFFGLHMGRLV
jgi:hypothetical protein